jgi:dTDP-glucose pyrophosphorylase
MTEATGAPSPARAARHAFVILTGGQVSSELAPIFGDVPSGLIPIRGKPALMHNLKIILPSTESEVYVVVGHKKELIERRVFRYLKEGDRRRIHEVVSDPDRRPGYSFRLALEHARADGVKSATVLLGDTLLTQEMLTHIRAGGAFVGVSFQYTNPARWALVEQERPLRILNKPADLQASDLPAIIGLYHLEGLDRVPLTVSDTEISDCLETYAAAEPLKLVEIRDWIDIGHIDNYYSARKKFIVTRHFNRIHVDEFTNTLTKSSENRDKLIAELDWYAGLPAELKWVYPTVYASDRETPSVKMEFVPYPSLDELYLYSDLHESTWSVILAKLSRLLELFNTYKADVSLQDYHDMYVGKVRQRIEELRRQGEPLRSLTEAPGLTVNGKECLSLEGAISAVESLLPRIYAEADHSIVHGDFCFPNILYSPESGAVKLIDPRGAWGKPGIYGDIKYDYAKLLHSISGGYDSIINDYFDVRANGGSIDAHVFKPRIADFLERTLVERMPHRPEVIELIEGTILVSIASIHREDARRQLAMLAVGIEKITRNAGRV